MTETPVTEFADRVIGNVETVIVEGRLLFDRGRYLTLDPEPIFDKATEYRDKVRSSLKSR